MVFPDSSFPAPYATFPPIGYYSPRDPSRDVRRVVWSEVAGYPAVVELGGHGHDLAVIVIWVPGVPYFVDR